MNVVAVSITDDLAGAGMVVGSRAPIITRICELLDGLERAGQFARVPDGRYRTVRARTRDGPVIGQQRGRNDAHGSCEVGGLPAPPRS